jgi:3-hydroxyisobutyrate dehydrogenase-like beta-hydroxyacid dehydrogenase
MADTPARASQLSPIEHERLAAWLARFGHNPLRCPICGGTQWLAEQIVLMMVGNTQVARHILLNCAQCYHAMMFDAAVIKASSADLAPSEPSTPDGSALRPQE